MNYYAIVDTNRKIIQLFGWGDNRPLPAEYPRPENTNIIGIPQNFAEEIQGKWQDTDVYVKDITVLMDSTQDYTEYFTDVAKEVQQAGPTMEELQKQVADLQTQIKAMQEVTK
ncbi:hypothetical protein [Clostridium luticellarii]|uniref:Uncharacterized protein n=1 Tax=Clostridium luticellarii TaxID=1691940 RepID=A0A2T0BLG4_9CLOT|nr:hypothetical protein [Clostridium luticellarii]PRR84734.1 hypothetical protein CLLU_22730 [Clostridium luticellarii]